MGYADMANCLGLWDPIHNRFSLIPKVPREVRCLSKNILDNTQFPLWFISCKRCRGLTLTYTCMMYDPQSFAGMHLVLNKTFPKLPHSTLDLRSQTYLNWQMHGFTVSLIFLSTLNTIPKNTVQKGLCWTHTSFSQLFCTFLRKKPSDIRVKIRVNSKIQTSSLFRAHRGVLPPLW